MPDAGDLMPTSPCSHLQSILVFSPPRPSPPLPLHLLLPPSSPFRFYLDQLPQRACVLSRWPRWVSSWDCSILDGRARDNDRATGHHRYQVGEAAGQDCWGMWLERVVVSSGDCSILDRWARGTGEETWHHRYQVGGAAAWDF